MSEFFENTATIATASTAVAGALAAAGADAAHIAGVGDDGVLVVVVVAVVVAVMLAVTVVLMVMAVTPDGLVNRTIRRNGRSIIGRWLLELIGRLVTRRLPDNLTIPGLPLTII